MLSSLSFPICSARPSRGTRFPPFFFTPHCHHTVPPLRVTPLNLLAWFTRPSSLSSYRSVSGCGCLAIGDLAAEKDNLVRLTQSGACEAAVGALRRHDDVPDVVVQACYAIHFLCFSQNNIAWMGANGTSPTLFSVPPRPVILPVPIHTHSPLLYISTQAHARQ